MEYNTIERTIIPERPKVTAKEELNVYVPTATPTTPGIASFDEKSFIVDIDGKVYSRRKGLVGIEDIRYNGSGNTFTIYYDDGTTREATFPIITEDSYTKQSLLSSITFTKEQFVQSGSNNWYLYLPPQVTGASNADYLAFVEVMQLYNIVDISKSIDGYVTVFDSIFKGSDGSMLVSSTVNPEDIMPRNKGRILILSGSLYTDKQIVSINYNKGKLTLTHAETDEDGNKETAINIADKKYVEDEINSRVVSAYYPQGNITAEELANIIPSEDNVGYIWILTTDIVTDDRFIEGSYEIVKAGNQVLVVERDGKYYFNAVGWLLDLVPQVYKPADSVSNKNLVQFSNVKFKDGHLYTLTISASSINNATKTYDTFKSQVSFIPNMQEKVTAESTAICTKLVLSNNVLVNYPNAIMSVDVQYYNRTWYVNVTAYTFDKYYTFKLNPNDITIMEVK